MYASHNPTKHSNAAHFTFAPPNLCLSIVRLNAVCAYWFGLKRLDRNYARYFVIGKGRRQLRIHIRVKKPNHLTFCQVQQYKGSGRTQTNTHTHVHIALAVKSSGFNVFRQFLFMCASLQSSKLKPMNAKYSEPIEMYLCFFFFLFFH